MGNMIGYLRLTFSEKSCFLVGVSRRTSQGTIATSSTQNYVCIESMALISVKEAGEGQMIDSRNLQ